MVFLRRWQPRPAEEKGAGAYVTNLLGQGTMLQPAEPPGQGLEMISIRTHAFLMSEFQPPYLQKGVLRVMPTVWGVRRMPGLESAARHRKARECTC